MFFYHNFYLFFLLLAVSFRHGFFLPAFLFKNTYRVFSDFNSRFYTHFSLLYTPISFRFVFFCLLSLQKTHAAVFRLQFSLLYTLFPSLHANQLPVCVFLLAFPSKNTCRVFSDFNSRFYTHFSLLYMPISFRFVFFCLLSLQKTHAVCFPTSILAFIHTFPFSTCQSASGLCFSACFLNMCFKHIFFPLSSYS